MTDNRGFSLLEMVVVLSVFALLAVISSQALILTLQGAKKSSNLATVRENVDFAIQIIERQLHNASEVTPCPNADSHTLTYKDQDGETTTFSCLAVGEAGYVASSSARLTSDDIAVTTCSISCIKESSGLPPYVEVNLSARNASSDTGPASSVTTSTRVFLRNY